MLHLRTVAFIALAMPLIHAANMSHATAPRVLDVELSDCNELIGHIVASDGHSISGVEITLSNINASSSEKTVTNDLGEFRFQFDKYKGGVYSLATQDTVSTCRVWRTGTAPPSATRQILMTSQPVQRGQCNAGYAGGDCGYFGGSPWANGPSQSSVAYAGSGEIINGGSCDSCGQCGDDCGCCRRRLLGRLRCGKCRAGGCCGGCCCCCLGGHKILVKALAIGVIALAIDQDDASL